MTASLIGVAISVADESICCPDLTTDSTMNLVSPNHQTVRCLFYSLNLTELQLI